MKTLLPLLVMTLILTMPQARAATYLIQLKNGGELKTYHYWEEDNDVRFYIYGGVAGIQKKYVKTIKEVHEESTRQSPVDQQLSETEQTEDKKAVEGAKERNPVKEEAKERNPVKIDIKYYKEKKAALKGKFDESWQRYIDATDNKDLETKKKAEEEMVGFSKQIYDLADEVREKNQGVLPDWWEQ